MSRRHKNTRMANLQQDPERQILTVTSSTGEVRPVAAADTADWYTRDGDAELAQLTQRLDQGRDLSQPELERLLMGAESHFANYQRRSLLAATVAGAVLVRIRDRIQAGLWQGDTSFATFLERISMPRRSAYDFIDLAVYRDRLAGFATCRTVREALAQVRELRAQEKGTTGPTRRSAADALVDGRRQLERLQQDLEAAAPDERHVVEAEIRAVEKWVSELVATVAAQTTAVARVKHAVALTSDQSEELEEHARRRGIPVETLLHTIVVQWVNRNRRGLSE